MLIQYDWKYLVLALAIFAVVLIILYYMNKKGGPPYA